MIEIGEKIYIEWKEAIASGISEATLKYANMQQLKCWNFIPHPKDKRSVLIEYATLKERYKSLIIENLCGGVPPERFFINKRLKNLLIERKEDLQALLHFEFSPGICLHPDKLNRYITAAKYAAMLSQITTTKIKALGFCNAPEFYQAVISQIKAEQLPLPTSYSRLKNLVCEYEAQGATALIDTRGMKGNNRKVEDSQRKVLELLFAKANQFDAEAVATMYNLKATKKGWPTIVGRTALNYYNKYKLAPEREGFEAWRNIADHTVKRQRPSAPNLLWVGDATPYELLYHETETDKKGNQLQKYHKRVVVYMVIDAFNDYIVGYAVGETETAELAKQAWKNACVWQGVIPNQIKTDHFSFKGLSEFYSKLTPHYTPAAVGNARDKVVEAFFGRIFKEVTKYHHNFSGHNITAKQQPNREYLNKIKQSFPDLNGVLKQLAVDVLIWNTLIKKSGTTREEQYRSGDKSQNILLTDLDRLLKFGKEHAHTNRLTKEGINFTVNGVTRSFMNWSDEFHDTLGTDYKVIYDEEDYSKIVVYSLHGKQIKRFLLEDVQAVPMALLDMKEGDRKRLNQQLNFKKRQQKRLIEQQADRQRNLEEHGLTDLNEPEKLAQLMFIDKHGNQKLSTYEAQNVLKSFGRYDIPEKSMKKKKLVIDITGGEEKPTSQPFNIYAEEIKKKPLKRIID